MIDADGYKEARDYFLRLYRSYIESAREWRRHSRRQAAWSLELTADCREKLINGVRVHRSRLAADIGVS